MNKFRITLATPAVGATDMNVTAWTEDEARSKAVQNAVDLHWGTHDDIGVLVIDELGEPSYYCKHGIYVGHPWGPDHLCGYCEDGFCEHRVHPDLTCAQCGTDS